MFLKNKDSKTYIFSWATLEMFRSQNVDDVITNLVVENNGSVCSVTLSIDKYCITICLTQENDDIIIIHIITTDLYKVEYNII